MVWDKYQSKTFSEPHKNTGGSNKAKLANKVSGEARKELEARLAMERVISIIFKDIQVKRNTNEDNVFCRSFMSGSNCASINNSSKSVQNDSSSDICFHFSFSC